MRVTTTDGREIQVSLESCSPSRAAFRGRIAPGGVEYELFRVT